MNEQYVVGVDFGSDSVRAAVVNTVSGATVGKGTAFYPRWQKGMYQHPEKGVFRQHPRDYLESLEVCIKEAIADLSQAEKKRIISIGVDTTGSTPSPVNREGIPLALTDEFSEYENAMFHLWKDHSAVAEAEELNKLFAYGSGIDYTKYQGTYCAEWFWAKILHTIRQDEKIKAAAYMWVEHCDWIVGVLCGDTRPETIYHSACAAGHKALWHREWKGLPAAEVLAAADPYLELVAARYGGNPKPATVRAGWLTAEWTGKLELSEGVAVSGSSFDAHAGAVGAGIREKTFVSTIGTSAVGMMVEKADYIQDKDIKEYGGQADDSILPGYVGIETGQAAFGDIFAWLKNLLLWPLRQMQSLMDKDEYSKFYSQMENHILDELQKEAAELTEEEFCIALDWFNGRRYPKTDDFQKGMIGNLSLGTDAPQLYRSLVFGAICGMRRIIEGLECAGIEIIDIIAIGGIPQKSEYIMQMMADVLGKEIRILDSDQACALGAAIYAAVAGGVYRDTEEAAAGMSAKCVKIYYPAKAKNNFYKKHYQEYIQLTKTADQWKNSIT